jgi:hypothetical protein
MDAGVHTVTDLLSAPGRLIIPVYQRPYVWSRDRQWEPLWSDIVWLLDGYLEGKTRTHFLGAIVLQQEKTIPGELPRRTVIDGQQRLTTLQILLAACAASAGEMGAPGVQQALTTFVRNSEHFVNNDDDVYKLWPTSNDRAAYKLVMQPGGPPVDAEDDPSNQIQEAFDYFADAAKEFAIAGGVDVPTIVLRFEALRNVLMQHLRVVSINLQEGDDAQVIFETLNARGTPLLEMDNVKNALLHRAGQQGVDVQTLNDTVWEPQLGDVYWRKQTRQGRLNRPRAELFLFHWLTMMSGEAVGATKLFAAFRKHMLDQAPGHDAAALARVLSADAAIMRGFDSVEPTSAAGRYFRALAGTDTTTVLPLTLLLFRLKELEPARRERALVALESFLVRRMLAGHTTKRYNQLFVEMLDPVKAHADVADEVLLQALSASSATSAMWPNDAVLHAHLVGHPMYNWISRPRLAYVLWELELVLRDTSKTEDVVKQPGRLSIEHVLPQQWQKTWPLTELDDEREARRNALVHVIGNLTLVTGELNSAMSNAAWPTKRERLDKSVLLLNRDVKNVPDWDERAITDRGTALADMVLKRWPGPEAMVPGFDPARLESPVKEIDSSRADLSESEMHAVLEYSSELMRILLRELAQEPENRRSYAAIEDALGWSRGRLASVLGGYAAYSTVQVGGKRPHRVGKDGDGELRIWVDAGAAEAIRSKFGAA